MKENTLWCSARLPVLFLLLTPHLMRLSRWYYSTVCNWSACFRATESTSCAGTPWVSWATLAVQNDEPWIALVAALALCLLQVRLNWSGNLEAAFQMGPVLNSLRQLRILSASALLGTYPWQNFTSWFRKQNRQHSVMLMKQTSSQNFKIFKHFL